MNTFGIMLEFGYGVSYANSNIFRQYENTDLGIYLGVYDSEDEIEIIYNRIDVGFYFPHTSVPIGGKAISIKFAKNEEYLRTFVKGITMYYVDKLQSTLDVYKNISNPSE